VRVSWADALIDMAERSLAWIGSTSRADRYRVYVHVTADDAWINAGPRLPEHALRRILDDTVITPVRFDEAGRAISIGRRSRTIPNHLRRMVLDRDRMCRNPMCANDRHLHIHHITWWSDGGRTDIDGLAGHCDGCHHAIHDGEITVTGNASIPDGLVYRRRDGTLITGPPPPIAPDQRPTSRHAYRHPLGEPLNDHWITFAPTATRTTVLQT
jgi:hypothetical protein